MRTATKAQPRTSLRSIPRHEVVSPISLGKETAGQLAAAGHTVYAGAG